MVNVAHEFAKAGAGRQHPISRRSGIEWLRRKILHRISTSVTVKSSVLLLGLILVGAVMACSSGKHDAPPPSLSDAEYRSALQAADATQAARNKGIIIVGTPAGDPIELATVGSRRAQHLDAYADDLARLIPPADLAKRHETMLKATKELAASNRKVAEHATGTSEAVLDIFSENGRLLEAFWLACRALTPEFICGTLTSSQADQ